jgi:surfeit locus 1 family protein
MSAYQFHFKPGMFMLVFVLATLFIVLGFWQIQRAEEKNLMQEKLQERMRAEPFEYSAALGENWQLWQYRRVILRGRFIAEKQVLIDNRVHNGKAGYHVITPFIDADTGRFILLNRGWITTGVNRNVLPDIVTPKDEVLVAGRISVVRSRPPMLARDARPDEYNEKVWSYLDVDYFKQKTGLRVEPYIVLVDSDLNDQLARDWPVINTKTGMHIGYAIQWFVFAIFVVVLFVAACFRKKTLLSKS